MTSPTSDRKAEILLRLKRLRSERVDQLERARALNKGRAILRRKIKRALAPGPQIVPTLAALVAASTDEVLWHLAAMRAYGLVTEDEQEGDYFRYRLVVEAQKGS